MATTHRSWTVDSIEEGVASVDDGNGMIRVPCWILPTGVREGDLLAVTREEDEAGSVTLHLRIDPEATRRALQRSREQVEPRGPLHDPGGHIQL